MKIYGRLGQLHLALANYESVNGILPNRLMTDHNGRPNRSWVDAILPFVDQGIMTPAFLDTSKLWDSRHDARSREQHREFWSLFSSDGYFVCAFDGADSIWDASGKPFGTMAEHPRKLVLVAGSFEGVQPFQSFTITEPELRRSLRAGQEVFFFDAGRTYGIVKLDGESIRFVRKQ